MIAVEVEDGLTDPEIARVVEEIIASRPGISWSQLVEATRGIVGLGKLRTIMIGLVSRGVVLELPCRIYVHRDRLNEVLENPGLLRAEVEKYLAGRIACGHPLTTNVYSGLRISIKGGRLVVSRPRRQVAEPRRY